MKQSRFIFSLLTALLCTAAVWANVGPQSIRVTFNGDNSEGWTASSGGSVTSVADGVANVQMHNQGSNYRADFQYQTSGTFTFDKTKDIVWAIKLTGALPGSNNAKKFEMNYKNSSGTDTWINHPGEGTSGDITLNNLSCNDGGVIYYVNLATTASTLWGNVQSGSVGINKIHFIFADATNLTDETAKYAVDWIASFASVNDLQTFKDWTDEAQEADPSLPYLELCFRPKSDQDSHETGYPYIGFKSSGFEGNYQARIFAVEYFLVDYSLEKIYTLQLNPYASNNAGIAVWDCNQQISADHSVSELRLLATSIVGIAPGSSEGTSNTPITTASCSDSKWLLNIPAYKLTPLATVGSKTLVGLFMTSKDLTNSSSAKFTTSNAEAGKVKPSFTLSETINPVVNLTQSTASANLADAVSAANANDVLELRGDVTTSSSRLDIQKALTIQGATGEEKIICGVAANTIMILATGSEEKTVTFKDLIVDGNNTSRSTQTFECGTNQTKLAFDNVRFINTTYSVICGDVKNNGSNIILKNDNSFPNGIYLNRDKRIDGQYATHTSPIQIYLSYDYVEDYAMVLCTSNVSQYEIVGGQKEKESAEYSVPWYLYDGLSGDKGHELKGKKQTELTLTDNTDNASSLAANQDKHCYVTLNRTIARNGDYATFCAPFAISREALEEHLGTTEVLRYKRTVIEGDEAVLIFDDDVTDLEAGVPYLIKPAGGDNVTSMTFNNVVIDNTLRESADAHYRFIPLFSQETVSNTGAENKSVVYLGASNRLYWAGLTCTINGFRAYFRVADGAAATMAPVRRMSFGRGAGVTTALDNSAADAAQSKRLENGRLVIVRDGVRYNALGQVIQ